MRLESAAVAVTAHVKEYEKETKRETPKKRALELDDYQDEENDTIIDFGDGNGAIPVRRGRKAGRRVSGVYREIKSLQSIGENAEVMELIFDRMTTKEVMEAGAVCGMWYIVTCRLLRKRLGNSSFLRLWNSDKSSKYLWMNWELHYHDELLEGGRQEDDTMRTYEKPKVPTIPNVQAIFSLGSHNACDQLTHEEAKLPYKQEYIFSICQQGIITAPNFSFTDTIDRRFGLDMVVQTLFIPSSQNFTMKAFALELSKETWTREEINGRISLHPEDTGPNQQLKAVFLTKNFDFDGTKSFVNELDSSILLLGGDSEEVFCNRVAKKETVAAVGYSFYTGPGAAVVVYGIDFTKDNADALLMKIKSQVDSAPHGFCFIFYNDTRPLIPPKDVDMDGDEENADESLMECDQCDYEKPTSETEHILGKIRAHMLKTPMVGLQFFNSSLDLKCSSDASNLDEASKESGLVFGLLLLTYSD